VSRPRAADINDALGVHAACRSRKRLKSAPKALFVPERKQPMPHGESVPQSLTLSPCPPGASGCRPTDRSNGGLLWRARSAKGLRSCSPCGLRVSRAADPLPPERRKDPGRSLGTRGVHFSPVKSRVNRRWIGSIERRIERSRGFHGIQEPKTFSQTMMPLPFIHAAWSSPV